MELVEISRQLSKEVMQLSFGSPVSHVYNPLDYAGGNYCAYVESYGRPTKQAVFLGMNPGPWGMVQTGIPFGDPAMVRDWLKMRQPINRPKKEHPKRPIYGIDCPRSEVSGTRFWGAMAEHFGNPEKFFERFFVANYCPLAFMEESGRNITPDKLSAGERKKLFAICDKHLQQLVKYLRPAYVIGVGAFAETQAKKALHGMDLTIGRILHPSPANPAANRQWHVVARKQLHALGICI
ncbi:MAG: uracil-DNA glycosylase family protein [Pseudomonadota bacterium]